MGSENGYWDPNTSLLITGKGRSTRCSNRCRGGPLLSQRSTTAFSCRSRYIGQVPEDCYLKTRRKSKALLVYFYCAAKIILYIRIIRNIIRVTFDFTTRKLDVVSFRQSASSVH